MAGDHRRRERPQRPALIEPRERGGYGLAAKWADDFHHAAHAFFTGEREGYYADFGGPAPLARALESPFVYAWDYSPYRDRHHRAPPVGLLGSRFVVCLQNHDQVGNRAMGDRLIETLEPPSKRRLVAGLLLLSPYLPLLFMGEEYGEPSPFPFFCSFGDPALVEAVPRGAEAGIRGIRLARGGPRPAGRGDLRFGEAELVVAGGDAPGGAPPAVP